VVVEVPVVEPTRILVIEPARPPVPRFRALVTPEVVRPLATLVVDADADTPKIFVAPPKVFWPVKLLFVDRAGMVPVVPLPEPN
jgi:hypothetical protein